MRRRQRNHSFPHCDESHRSFHSCLFVSSSSNKLTPEFSTFCLEYFISRVSSTSKGWVATSRAARAAAAASRACAATAAQTPHVLSCTITWCKHLSNKPLL